MEENRIDLLNKAQKSMSEHDLKSAREYNEKYIENELEYIKNKYINKKCYSFNNAIEFILFCNKEHPDGEIVYIDSKISEAYYGLGYIDIEENDLEKALEHLDESLKWNPYNIHAFFEKCEIYKRKKDFEQFKAINMEVYDKIYSCMHMAHFYRNLGFYYVEVSNWDLAKAVYLYSLKYENNQIAKDELNYIINTTKDSSLPPKEELKNILTSNNIPVSINMENVYLMRKAELDLEKDGKGNAEQIKKFVNECLQVI